MLRLRLLATLISTASVLLVPSAAHAERVVTDDAAADAQTIQSDAEEEVFTVDPEQTTADVVRTVVAHGERRIRVQVRYRDLEQTFPMAAYVKVRTPDRRFDIQTSRNDPSADTQLTRGLRDDPVRCPGLHTSVDPTRDQLTVSVPTACLDNPGWVRVGVLSVVVEVDVDSQTEEPYPIHFDDAHMTAGFEDHGVRLGPKVFVG